MPVEETLDKLDPPAASAEETPRHLWDALKAGFRQYANLKEADFSRWALSNVDRKILKNAADSRLANEIKSLRPDFPSRYATVLTAFDVSLGILLQLFGFKVVSSRACNSSFIQLCKARPDLRIEELYDAWNTQPTVVNSRLISEITRFQRAANSDSPEASRQLCRVRQRETSSLDVAPSPPFKRARPLQSDPFGPLETPRSSVQRSALDFTLSPFEPESTNDRDTPPEVSSLPSYMAQSQGQEHDSDTSEDEFVDSAVYFDMDDETEQPVAETGQTNHGAASCHESQSSEKGSNLAKMVLDDIEHTDRIKRIRLRIAQDETYAAEASQKKNDSEECITELRRKTLARLQAIEDQNEGSLDEVDEEEDWYSISKAKADAMGHQEEIEKEMASSVRRKRVADRALGAEMKKRPRVAEAAQKLRDALQELENAVEEPLPPCE
ncbi:hypothetical protein CGMCC3_g16603 [Colletotrichum fructicola]|uniref:Uncharacterized protein n=1 Tax=Colletotrichum fructicola (strain Nara gc5) TaxID=1213859 RepID=A0A7J6IBV8_COLFN|nr:uncharacterized protein CGMCC3_g16603 [Colletotrichum fructicola]KAE9567237.1 hypothetical protein CGMCC3_g16603 [Colletotrichum fructicola]KAF4473706.1 hypothetical protein CGGC5_v017314 [Colletotrichum fructicola Nara gc5]